MRDAIQDGDITHALRQHLEAFGKTLSPALEKLWLESLGPRVTPKVFKNALLQHARESRQIPRPADIIALINNPGPRTEHREKPEPASPEVARAWMFVIRHWGFGDMFPLGDVSAEDAERYIELCNRQAKQNNNPDSIPPDLWLVEVWGCQAFELQSEYIHQGRAA